MDPLVLARAALERVLPLTALEDVLAAAKVGG
jgi:hypothetical protein